MILSSKLHFIFLSPLKPLLVFGLAVVVECPRGPALGGRDGGRGRGLASGLEALRGHLVGQDGGRVHLAPTVTGVVVVGRQLQGFRRVFI